MHYSGICVGFSVPFRSGVVKLSSGVVSQPALGHFQTLVIWGEYAQTNVIVV